MGRPRTKNKHLPKYVTIIHGSYWYRPPGIKGKRVARVGAEMKLYKYIAENAAPIVNSELNTIADAIDRYEREVLPTKAPRTQNDYIRHLKLLRKVFGHMQPNDLAPRDIGRFLDVPKGKILRNRQVAVLSAIYSKMVGRWYCADRNPCKGVERNKARPRKRYVSDAEYAALRASASDRIQVAMDLALRSYQRQGDVLTLKWEQVTPTHVLFEQGKTGRKLAVKRGTKLNAALERAAKLKPVSIGKDDFVLRTQTGRPYTSEGFRAVWQRTMRQALERGVIATRFTFHDLRRKAITDTRELQKAFEGAGHTDIAMTRGVYDAGVREVDSHEEDQRDLER